ncbi:MAG TPA: hypothetical protein VEJ84_23785 [Acidimicrobiales bacterium]|nr:hypothetical protein [Acidimicrobiales bacterium]
MRSTSTKTAASEAVLVTYEPAGPVRYGSYAHRHLGSWTSATVLLLFVIAAGGARALPSHVGIGVELVSRYVFLDESSICITASRPYDRGGRGGRREPGGDGEHE